MEVFKKQMRDFPRGPMVKNPPSNAEDVGSIPGWGTKIPHATGQLSLHATTTELARLNERAHVLQTTEPMRPGAHAPWSPRNTTREEKTCTPQLERSPHITTKSLHATKTRRSQKKKKKN